jgi:Mg2+/Co2+ transporter CorB
MKNMTMDERYQAMIARMFRLRHTRKPSYRKKIHRTIAILREYREYENTSKSR